MEVVGALGRWRQSWGQWWGRWGHLSIGPFFLVSFEASQTRPKSRCLGACENSLDWAALVLVGSLLLVRMVILSHVIPLSYLIKSLV